MTPEQIAVKARRSLWDYCMNECSAYCCRKGYLVITPAEAKLITKNKIKDFEEKGLLKKLKTGKYSLFMGKQETPCPALNTKDFTCTIHTKKGRPQVCKDYPVFVSGNKVKLSSRCPGIKRLYPFIAMWKKKNCVIVESFPVEDFDIYS